MAPVVLNHRQRLRQKQAASKADQTGRAGVKDASAHKRHHGKQAEHSVLCSSNDIYVTNKDMIDRNDDLKSRRSAEASKHNSQGHRSRRRQRK